MIQFQENTLTDSMMVRRRDIIHRILPATASGLTSAISVTWHLKVKDMENSVDLTKNYCITVTIQEIGSIHTLLLKIQQILRLFSYYVSHTSFRGNLHSAYLNVKELLARNRRYIWSLSDWKRIRAYNHLVCKHTFNHLAKLASLAKCLSVPLQTKWLWVQIPL